MGNERWRRSLRSPSAVVTFVALAASIGIQIFGSLPPAVRVTAAALALACVASAVEAWRAAVIVGTDGIRSRGVFRRQHLRWEDITGFFVSSSPRKGRLTPRVALRGDRSVRLGDYDLPAASARKVVEALLAELSRASSLRSSTKGRESVV